MYLLSIREADMLVRKNFDEQAMNDTAMLDLNDVDSDEFDSLVAKTLPEAINDVHLKAPVQILEGITLSTASEYDPSMFKIEDGVLTFGITRDFLRLITFQASDSPYPVSEVVAEYSPEGRMQLNPYTRGSSERPRLVLQQGRSKNALTLFKYYTLDTYYSQAIQAISRFEYLPMYKYDDKATGYQVAENVVGNIIDELTGRLMMIYGNANGATFFLTRAGFGQPSTE